VKLSFDQDHTDTHCFEVLGFKDGMVKLHWLFGVRAFPEAQQSSYYLDNTSFMVFKRGEFTESEMKTARKTAPVKRRDEASA